MDSRSEPLPAARARAWPLTALLPAALVGLVALAAFIRRCVVGIHFLVFGDESGHLLGARAIAAGDRLYRDFIDAHGPFSFMVAHAWGVLFGWAEPLDARWATAGLIAAAGASVTASSVMRNMVARLWAMSLFLGLMAAPWLVQGLNMVSYHPLGGALVAVALAWLVVPVWVDAPLARWRIGVSGVCLAWLCGTAYALAPSALLFAGASAIGLIRRGPGGRPPRALLTLAVGFGAGCLVLLAWLLRYGDLVGYVVFHFIQLQVNYARYFQSGWTMMFDSLVPSTLRWALVHATAILTGAVSLALLVATNAARLFSRRGLVYAAELLLWLFGVLMLNYRGLTLFQDGTFLVATATLLALALPMALAGQAAAPRAGVAWAGSALVAVILLATEVADRKALDSPWGYSWKQARDTPPWSLRVNTTAPIFKRVHQALRPGERMLVLVYNPTFFLEAGVLPMKKYHEFLPWEQDYARAPWFGRERDLCADLARTPPPVIIYDAWKVWGQYDPATFIPCLASVLAANYHADTIPTLYIRNDRVANSSSGS